ncbi:hypothetical protein [Mycolicibacterium phlei]|uniref:hypothetical protein n=1 Tax=Mycolicibacterium phlei TaxID=1771 RepID=UPI00025AF34A|nr:hypothetical protein [Mycolicibacterium phlei]EID09506.1 hypothetical protein MPHLEI_26191 [Mycolicibacterium phlei RIVM601174]MBF4194970.1 hypothetical protein [Mycolicibacterium phlei]
MTPSRPAARLRGAATGLLTATLALAAHGAGLPSGAALVLLAVLATGVGAVGATLPRAGELPALLGLLAAGQLAGHVLLSAGHVHAGTPPGPEVVLLAHLTAILLGATLIAAGDRLCRAVTRAVRAAVRVVCAPVPAGPARLAPAARHPLRSALLLASSVSHRGPPAVAVA